MKDQLINFDVAKLAKEKGFKEYCIAYFSISGEEMYFREDGMYFHSNGANGRLILRPTQSLLKKWLREEHRIIVFIIHYHENREDYFYPYIVRRRGTQYDDKYPYKTYEEAIEEGLLKALQMIK